MNAPPDMNSGPVSPAINVLDVVRGVARRKLMIFSFTALAFLAGIAAINFIKPVYSTEAQVLVDNLETRFDRIQSLENQAVPNVDDRVVASQMAVLRSDDIARRVI